MLDYSQPTIKMSINKKHPPKHARFLLLSAILASVSVGGMCDTTPIQQLYGIAALAGAGGNPVQGDDGEMDQPPPRDIPEENLDGDPDGAVHGFFSKPPDENEQYEDMYGDEEVYGVDNGR